MMREGLAQAARMFGAAAGLKPAQIPGLQLIFEIIWDEAQRAAAPSLPPGGAPEPEPTKE